MASVFGPLEAKIQKELPDRMYVEVNCKPKVGMPGSFIRVLLILSVINDNPLLYDCILQLIMYIYHSQIAGVSERGKEKLIKTTCDHIILTHMHPRTAVNVTIQEMQDGGMVI